MERDVGKLANDAYDLETRVKQLTEELAKRERLARWAVEDIKAGERHHDRDGGTESDAALYVLYCMACDECPECGGPLDKYDGLNIPCHRH
jgi:hypothetical protein